MKRHKFRGKTYTLIEVPSDAGGECSDPNCCPRELLIPIEGESEYDLEVIIHEGIHACCWDICETSVREISHDIANLLWKLGWRKEY